MKSEKGVTLISLLTYIAVLLTVMVIVGRITGFFNKGLDIVDADNQASTDISKLNYCFLMETKNTQAEENITANINFMQSSGQGYEFPNTTEETTTDTKGQAIKFLNTNNVISFVNNKVYYNKVKICDNVQDFWIDYNSTNNAIDVEMTIDGQEFSQTYTFR